MTSRKTLPPWFSPWIGAGFLILVLTEPEDAQLWNEVLARAGFAKTVQGLTPSSLITKALEGSPSPRAALWIRRQFRSGFPASVVGKTWPSCRTSPR